MIKRSCLPKTENEGQDIFQSFVIVETTLPLTRACGDDGDGARRQDAAPVLLHNSSLVVGV
jgi:hypothetical protein